MRLFVSLDLATFIRACKASKCFDYLFCEILVYSTLKLQHIHVKITIRQLCQIKICDNFLRWSVRISFLNQGGYPLSATEFPDFSLTKFNFSLTKILRFYGFFLFLQLINDKFSFIAHFKKCSPRPLPHASRPTPHAQLK